MTAIELPAGDGYDALVISGVRGAGETNGVEAAGAVVVKRSFRVVGGALVPDGAGEKLTLADAIVTEPPPGGHVARVTNESDLVPAKRTGDVVVLGHAAAAGRVDVAGTVWLRRSPIVLDPLDRDLAVNLFGWQPRASSARAADARPLTGGAAAGDRLSRHYNAQRRAGDGGVTTATTAALPTAGAIAVWQNAEGSGAAWTATYSLAPLRLTLLVHEGRCPDRATRWCPRDLGPLVLDTLVVRPDAGTVSAVWRASWPAADFPPDQLRAARVAV